MMINDKVYEKLTTKKISEIVSALKAESMLVEREIN